MASRRKAVPSAVQSLREGIVGEDYIVRWSEGRPILLYSQVGITARCPDDETAPSNWGDDERFDQPFFVDAAAYRMKFWSDEENCGSAIGPALGAFARLAAEKEYPAWPVVHIEAHTFLARRLGGRFTYAYPSEHPEALYRLQAPNKDAEQRR